MIIGIRHEIILIITVYFINRSFFERKIAYVFFIRFIEELLLLLKFISWILRFIIISSILRYGESRSLFKFLIVITDF